MKPSIKLLLLVAQAAFLLFFSQLSFASPAVIPTCSGAQTQASGNGLIRTVYETDTPSPSHPNNHSAYNTFVATYAIPGNLEGSGVALNINGVGNPFGDGNTYLTLFTGYIEVPTTGNYIFAVDGDDAVEVIIDGAYVTGWHGGHGKNNSPNFPVTISLDAGYHDIEFRHEEIGGGDNYYLYWQPPSAGSFAIVPGANFSSCQDPPVTIPAVSPTCVTPLAQLQLRTYDTTGYGTYPNNHSEYNTLIEDYALTSNLLGSSLIANVNGSGSPHDPDDTDYLAIFTGYIFSPSMGTYFFGVDGDDAVEVLINGQSISGFYGAHGSAGTAQDLTPLNLNSGYYEVEFRHQERAGGDNYFFYWQKPGDVSPIIVPPSSLTHCVEGTTIEVTKTHEVVSDPVNLIVNAKSIPGAVIRYTVIAENTGDKVADSIVINDDLNNLITVLGYGTWVDGSIFVTSPPLYSGATTNLTDASDADEGEFIDTTGNRLLSVNCGSLSAAEQCIVTYEIVIN